ncbi:MAG: bifunctional riboflavin kinase/FAD synthetase [Alphaproteobacteria bacterium]
MKIFNKIKEYKKTNNLVLAIGNFDGVHLGHQAILEQAKNIAKEKNYRFGVMTFEPHPKTYFNPDLKNFRLTPINIKKRLLTEFEIEELYVIDFNHSFSQTEPEDFIKTWVKDKLNVKHIVVGYDFVFGKNGKGNAETLRQMSSKYDFDVTIVSQISNQDGLNYSSTAVRNALFEGFPLKAASILGRFFELNGRIQLGRQTGAKLGFPTANTAIGNFFKPKEGIYAVFADIILDGKHKILKGVTNIGGSPTFDINNYLVETHLLNFSGDIYKKNLTIYLVDYIRDSIKFNSVDDLIKEITLDTIKAQDILLKYEKSDLLKKYNN